MIFNALEYLIKCWKMLFGQAITYNAYVPEQCEKNFFMALKKHSLQRHSAAKKLTCSNKDDDDDHHHHHYDSNNGYRFKYQGDLTEDICNDVRSFILYISIIPIYVTTLLLCYLFASSYQPKLPFLSPAKGLCNTIIESKKRSDLSDSEYDSDRSVSYQSIFENLKKNTDCITIADKEDLDLELIKLNFTSPDRFLSNLSVRTEIQVRRLEVRNHPSKIHGIPWELMNNERYRLISFVEYPSDSLVSTIRLASKGFAYLGKNSHYKVICCFCAAQLRIFEDEGIIDEEHKRLTSVCPMVTGAQCDNISMKHQYPKKNATDIFLLLSCIPSENKKELTSTSNDLSASNQNNDAQCNTRSSQPSDENASHVVVTNTSDLAESDGAIQNSAHSIQSSQIMDDFSAPRDHQESLQNSDSAYARTTTSNDTTQNSHSESSGGSSSQQSNTQQSNENPNSNGDNSGETTSYEKLGIITARPKRLEYALLATRLQSYDEWPKEHHMKPDDLARAGYFYTGYSDCARCFYCGGGLRNWETEDNVWVEHARWFPKCAFLLQEVGKDFIDAVQSLSRDKDDIKYEDVIQVMQESGAPSPLKFKERVVERDPAVLSVIDNGFDKDQIVDLALGIRKAGELLSSDKLYEAAKTKKVFKKDSGNNLGSDSVSIRKGGNEKRDKETINKFRSDNNELRQQTLCKICLDMEVAVVFLPCGHLVSCTECSCALTACPVCRVGIKGIVRAYMG